LRAKELYRRDRDYIVRDGKVVIVGEGTGRGEEEEWVAEYAESSSQWQR